jgi:outer membrane protein OmpA-like peptidoglycan-associated protein
MSNPKSYLPEVFTLEWDMFVSKSETEESKFGEEKFELQFRYPTVDYRNSTIEFWWRSWDDGCDINYQVRKPNFSGDADYIGGDSRDLVAAKIVKKNAWNHFAVSFNKRALKVYINGVRIFNIPNMEAPGWFVFWQGGNYKYRGFTNVVLAKGGVDLYEQKTTDLSAAAAAVEKAIAETGKFVTNNILFETGKATLKPESMEEILKVAEYMKKNPGARFEVQGHTDNQGSDKVNDPLSQQRAEAVVKALEEQGVDPFNLRPVGKGSHEPVADNKTEDGRAKNRRVEFIKK